MRIRSLTVKWILGDMGVKREAVVRAGDVSGVGEHFMGSVGFS